MSRGEEDDNGARVFARLPTDFEPVRLGDTEFKAALVTLVLDMPLRVAASAPVQSGRGLAPGIVEQRAANLKRFGPEALHNTENVVPLEEGLHVDVSAFYSSKQEFITGSSSLTVRQWLNTRSYEAQRQFGLRALENVKSGIWRVGK